MKKLIDTGVKPFGERDMELGVTCVGDDVRLGDRFETETQPPVIVQVQQIEVYRAAHETLFSGYTGTIYVTVVSGDPSTIQRVLIERPHNGS